MKPLCIDLYCGLGGWTEGFLAEGWDVIGFDIEQHVYGVHRYPAQLVLQDVRTLDGAQFKDAAIIVSSSPCQEFSYRAMPWKRAKALGPPLLGMELFAQAFRIQKEASAAAGRHIPMIQENVRGAQKYVGRAQWHYGSYYLWGDVPALMPFTMRGERTTPVGSWDQTRANYTADHSWSDAIKNAGGSWFVPPAGRKCRAKNNPDGRGSPGQKVTGQNPVHDGVKQPGIGGPRKNGKGDAWFQDGAARHGSKSTARKAASAAIARIPLPLASHIARIYKPVTAYLVATILTGCALAFPAHPSRPLTARDLRAWCAVQGQRDTSAVRAAAKRDGIRIWYDGDSLRCSAVTWDGRR